MLEGVDEGGVVAAGVVKWAEAARVAGDYAEDVERFGEADAAGRGGRHGDDAVVAGGDAEGGTFDDAVGLEVVGVDLAAGGVDSTDDGVGDGSAVEGGGAVVGDGSQGSGELWAADAFAEFGWAVVWENHGDEGAVLGAELGPFGEVGEDGLAGFAIGWVGFETGFGECGSRRYELSPGA